jgi:hypothetical protein
MGYARGHGSHEPYARVGQFAKTAPVVVTIAYSGGANACSSCYKVLSVAPCCRQAFPSVIRCRCNNLPVAGYKQVFVGSFSIKPAKQGQICTRSS